jgi:phosphoribosylformimino-5-aminoimidazole carboxamide ribotide isomerase
MELIPAIDLLDGKVVRLHQGRYDAVTVYGADPTEIARRYHAAGARSLHVVDLDGARDGRAVNVAAIESVLRVAELRVQVGGGVRDRETAQRWWDAGAARVVLGTAAVKDPQLVVALSSAHPGGVVVAIDARGDDVAIEGWLEASGRRVVDVAREADRAGAAAILHTRIERDGTREGPDVEGTASLQEIVRATVIASGGIGTLDHIRALARAGVRAAVCGRALLSGEIDPAEAIRAAAEEQP